MIKTVVTSKTWNGGAITRDMFEEIQSAMNASADRIAADARSRVNLGPGKPEHLRDTIRARPGRYGRLRTAAHLVATGEYETALPVAYVFAGNRKVGVYWHYMVEYGTYESPAHPYMRPALDENFNPTLAEAERAGRRALLKRRRERARARRAA